LARTRFRWFLSSLVVHGVLLGTALLLHGPRPAPAPAGEGGELDRTLAGTVDPPTPPSESEEPPPEEDPSPLPEPEPTQTPEVEPPEPAPEHEVALDSLPEPAPPPPEAPLVRPYEPTPADDAKRLRTRTTLPAPAPQPTPRSPVAAPPSSGRPALRELERPDPPRPPDVPSNLDLELLLEYTVEADGRVSEARVMQSSGWPALDESTRDFVVHHWRYQPPGEQRRVLRRVRFRVGG
jgi:TonB family protein